jgi:taurine transport system permease protein
VSALLSAPAAETALAEPGTAAAVRRRRSASRWQRIGVRVLATAALLGLWQLLYSLHIWNPVLLPSPGAVWDALIRTSTTHDDGTVGYQGKLLIEHLGISLRRIGLGSVLGIAGGLVIGLLMGTLPWFRIVVEPWVSFVRALPPLAYFSLLIIWLGIDESPKIWLLAIAAMPPVAVATAAAVVGAPTALVEAARAMGARGWQVTTTVVLPAALPEIATGIRLAVGIAYSSLVAAETVNGLPGIGGMIRQAQTFLQSDVVILGLFAIGLSGLAIDGVLRAIERRLVPWRGRA